jgi:hypothetical protein
LEPHPTYYGQVRIASALNFLLGLWVLAAPFTLGYSVYSLSPIGASRAIPNDIIVGLLVAVIAAIRFLFAQRQDWLSWINMLLGAYLVFAPFIWAYGYYGYAAGSDVFAGALIAWISIWSALATRWSKPAPREDWAES